MLPHSDNIPVCNFCFMKKFFSILFALIIAIVSFASCEKSDPKVSNPLVGTKWFASYSDYLMVLEFTSDSDVIGYFATDNGVYYSGKTSGAYKIAGNSVTFSDLSFRWMYAYYRPESASVSESLLSVTGQYTFNIDKGDWSAWSKTFSKQ